MRNNGFSGEDEWALHMTVAMLAARGRPVECPVCRVPLRHYQKAAACLDAGHLESLPRYSEVPPLRNSGFGARAHVASPTCWCEPERVHVEDDGTAVWRHREVQ